VSDVPDGPPGQDEPWVTSLPPLTAGDGPDDPAAPVLPFTLYGFELADDFRADMAPGELTKDEEDYRSRAYEAVLHFALDFGLEIFPVWHAVNGACACRDGISCPSAGKHPADLRWPETATSDPERAARWWRPVEPREKLTDWRPLAGVGARMGSRHFILDVDTDAGKAGEQSLARLVAEHGEAMPATLAYQTGGGGRQHIMLIPPGIEVRSSASKLGDNLDIKGMNGYGILPPSRSGKGEYRMLADQSPDVPPPAWLADWLREQHRQRTERVSSSAAALGGQVRQVPLDGLTRRAQAYISGALASAVQKVSQAEANHNRNTTLNDEAFSLFARFGPAGFLDPDDIAAALQDAAEACGLYGTEIGRTIASACGGALRKPRDSELPDFLFEVPGPEHPDGLVKLGIKEAVYRFEEDYDLREAVGGEFYARPSEAGTPAVVTEIGDALGRKVALWWRDAAEAWNESLRKRRQKAAEEKAAAEAAEAERLEGLSRRERAEAEEEQLAQAKADLEAGFAGPAGPEPRAGEDEDTDKEADVFPSPGTIDRILFHLRASASRHERVDLHMRVTDEPGRLVVDLCDDQGSVVLITAGGWQVCDVREVPGSPWFRRGRQMLPQVVPQPPDDVMAALKDAQSVIGLDDSQWALVFGYLVGGHFPGTDRPGIWFSGPSGAGKTTRAKMAAGLIDPAAELGGRINLKRDPRDARAKAMNRYLFSMDNIGHVSPDESDFWCTLHTGSADEVRQLNTDNVMLTYAYKRIGMGTSVNLPEGFQPDALRRLVHVELEATDDHPDAGLLWQAYDTIKAEVLGALFSVLAGVLGHLDEAMAADLPGCPELSAYARRLHAADLAYPGLRLYEAYRRHAEDIMAQRGLEDPLAILVCEAMDKLPPGELGRRTLDDSPARLYQYLENVAGTRAMERWWPVGVTQLGHRLTLLDAPLRRLGVTVKRGPRTKNARSYRIVSVRGIGTTAGARTGDADP